MDDRDIKEPCGWGESSSVVPSSVDEFSVSRTTKERYSSVIIVSVRDLSASTSAHDVKPFLSVRIRQHSHQITILSSYLEQALLDQIYPINVEFTMWSSTHRCSQPGST